MASAVTSLKSRFESPFRRSDRDRLPLGRFGLMSESCFDFQSLPNPIHQSPLPANDVLQPQTTTTPSSPSLSRLTGRSRNEWTGQGNRDTLPRAPTRRTSPPTPVSVRHLRDLWERIAVDHGWKRKNPAAGGGIARSVSSFIVGHEVRDDFRAPTVSSPDFTSHNATSMRKERFGESMFAVLPQNGGFEQSWQDSAVPDNLNGLENDFPENKSTAKCAKEVDSHVATSIKVEEQTGGAAVAAEAGDVFAQADGTDGTGAVGMTAVSGIQTEMALPNGSNIVDESSSTKNSGHSCEMIVCGIRSFTVETGHKVHEIDLSCDTCKSQFVMTAAHDCNGFDPNVFANSAQEVHKSLQEDERHRRRITASGKDNAGVASVLDVHRQKLQCDAKEVVSMLI